MAKKSEDLIDFFDDIKITMQSTVKKEDKIEDLQIKMLEEFLKTSKIEKNIITPEQDEEFSKFLDKYERKYKTDGDVDRKHEVSHNLNKENLDEEVPSCSRFTNLPLSLLEDEIPVKNYFVGDTFNKEEQNLSYIVEKPKVLTPNLNKDNDFNEDLIDEVLIEKNIEMNNNKAKKIVSLEHENFKLNNNITKNDFDKKSNVDDLESSNEYDDIMNEIISKNEIKCYGVKEVKNNNFKLKTKEEKEFINTLVTKYNLTYLEPVKKAEKNFKKRSVLKSDIEKAGLSPGPTLYEKAIVLPKMMKQLEDRKLEKEKKVERKLILGGGYSVNRNDFENTENDVKMLMNVKNDSNEATSKSENYKKGVTADNKILEPPQLVMEDCNRERLIAFETRRRFQNFIRTGNYYPDES